MKLAWYLLAARAFVTPKWLFRYVDDSYVCVKREHVDEFHSHLNSINLHIKFTIEIESEGSTGFLDTKKTRQEDGRPLCLSTGKLLTPTLFSNHTTIPSTKTRAHSHGSRKEHPSAKDEVSRETKRVAKALAANNYRANFIHNGRQPNKHRTH